MTGNTADDRNGRETADERNGRARPARRRAVLATIGTAAVGGCLRTTDETAADAQGTPTAGPPADGSTAGTAVAGADDGANSIPEPESFETDDVAWALRTEAPIAAPPALGDDTVYVGSQDQRVYALDTETGEVRWRTGLGEAIMGRPLVRDGTVYVHLWGASAAVALDGETGAVRWRHSLFDGPVTPSPLFVDGRVVTAASVGEVMALDSDGEVVWRYNINDSYGDDRRGTVPDGYLASHDDNVYATSRDEDGRLWLHHLSAAGQEYALNDMEYVTDTGPDAPLVGGGEVVCHPRLDSDALVARDPATAETVWALSVGASPSPALTVADGSVLLQAMLDGRMTNAEVGLEGGDVLWRHDTNSCCGPPPVTRDATAFADAGSDGIVAIDRTSGDVTRTWDPPAGGPVTPGIDHVYVGGDDGRVYALTDS